MTSTNSALRAAVTAAGCAVLVSCASLSSKPAQPIEPTDEAGLMTVNQLQALLSGTEVPDEDILTYQPPADTLSARPAPSAAAPAPASPRTARDTTASLPVRSWIQLHPGETADPITVSFLGDALPDVLTLFSQWSGRSILMGDEAEVRDKRISGEIRGRAWNVAIESLLRAHNLRAIQDTATDIITVVSLERSLAERDPEIIRLKYIDAEDVLPTLESIIGAGPESEDVIDVVRTGEQSRTLLVYTSPEKMGKLRDMVDKLDRKRPTVTIQAKMIFVNRSQMEKLGFSYQIVPGIPTVTAPATTAANGATSTATSAIGPVAQVGQYGAALNQFGQTGAYGAYGNNSMGRFGGSGYGGYNQMGMSGQQQGNSALSLMQTLSLSGNIDLNVFFDVLKSTGFAEVEAAPVITTTSDLEAKINVGEFFILPNQMPILAAQNLSQFQNGANGMYPGQQGMYPGAQGMYPGQQGGYANGGYANGGYNQGGYANGGYNQGAMGQSRFQGGTGARDAFETGTELQVTPFVLPNGRVRLKISISRDGGTLSSDGQTLTGATQEATTEVTVRNDESLVIGGLTVVQRTTTTTGIPVLSGLPILGHLFRSTETAEVYQDLVIVVTPHIIPDDDDDISR